jgi:hypothetical protein
VFADIDHIKSELVFEKVLKKVSNIYDVPTNEISYTKSIKEDINEFSYHLSIPSLVTSMKDLKKHLLA